MYVNCQDEFLGEVLLTASAKQTMFWEGQDSAYIFQLRSGIVRGVTISEDGERQILAFFFAGDHIGLPITQSYRFSAEAVTDVTYVRQTRGHWNYALAESCLKDGSMLRCIGAEQDPIYRRGMLLGRQGAVTRMAAFLCSIIDRLPQDGVQFDLPISQQDIADYLALTPETVCRSLKRLKQSDIIAMPAHNRLVIHDRDALERAAQSRATCS
ncbi:MAG: helix-turn-helix domain-containing protein [Parasphingorhabdus sp.]|uniref:helix-turn-helix domain-containing protein n=1 Tax=Parasphingorhabdus sp. TaxID=2709688 RepID=UPI0030030F4E